MRLRRARIVTTNELELIFDAALPSGRRRRVSVLIDAAPRLEARAKFPHILNEMGESLGSDELDGLAQDNALAVTALFEAHATWRRFKAGLL